jgi:threonylcarbamoyladenosine tRNA methylthiotransferase MtaB
MTQPTVSFYTLGCRLNQSETAVLERNFEAEGFCVVAHGDIADIVIINTCTVTGNGDTDTRRLVNKVNRLNPHARIALIGCQAQVYKERLLALPNVRWVIGNARKMEMVSFIQAQDKEASLPQPQVIAPPIPRGNFTIPVCVPRIGMPLHEEGKGHAAGRPVCPAGRRTRANIKIQDGCDFFCSFCEIPYARGRARSRKFEDINLEANALVTAGHKELVITGINVGTYSDEGRGFLDVMDALEQIAGLERIRISSIEPTTVPAALLKKMSGRTKLCRHLHLPLQSASDSLLQQMKRRYSAQEFKNFVRKAAGMVPEICLGTDLIVGFPCETPEEFEASVRFLREEPIHYSHVFSYSARSLAASRKLPAPVTLKVVQERSRILRDLSGCKRRIFYESLVGTRQNVLFEEEKEGYWIGLTDNYVRVHLCSDRHLANQFIEVDLVERDGQVMRGVLSAGD